MKIDSSVALRPSRPFQGVGAFLFTELWVQLHESLAIFSSIIIQAVILVFVAILQPVLLPVALMGALIFSIFTLGSRVQNEAAYIRIDHKLNQLYLASPLTAEAYFLGMAAGVLLAYLGPIAVLVAIAEFVIHLNATTVVALFATGGAIWLFSSSFGYILSTFFRDQRAIWAYSTIIFNLFGVLPPVFYPLALFPSELRTLALVLPTSAATGILQATLTPGVLSGPEVILATVALGIETVATFLLALFWARRTVRER